MFRHPLAALLVAVPLLAHAAPTAVIEAAIALACAETPADAHAMAVALGVTLDAERPIEMGETTFGWRRSFTLPEGGTLRLTRLAPGETLRRIEAEYTAVHGGTARPELIA